MKKLCFVLLLILAFLSPTMGQKETITSEERVLPKDSLPDLWIVTIDMSGSMKKDGKLPKIPLLFRQIVGRNDCDQAKDRFILLSSGMTFDELRSSSRKFASTYGLRYDGNKDFASILIKGVLMNSTYGDVLNELSMICGDAGRFRYDRSFASIARPLSIQFLTENKHYDFLNYRNVYHIQITDNGDTND